MTRAASLRFLVAALIAALLAGCAASPAPAPATPAPQAATAPAIAAPSPARSPADAEVDAILARLTLEQKVGQLVVIGIDGPGFDAGAREMIEKYRVGGVILFARNVESPAQVARLTNAMQAAARAANGLGLFLAIDQEGGRVARLTANKGFTEFPGAMALGATALDVQRAAANARRVGEALAEEMIAVGLNTNFAPDLDVNNNPANPVIGIRSYGSSPARVAELGVACVEGLQGRGVLAFGKHFPGHGDTAVDSHADLPIVGHARARLETVEFVPFKAAIAKNIAGIMSAHVSFPTIDATLPGTLSGKVLTDLLRHELHFDGLVATDSLEMGALGRSGFPAPRAAARALQAGADLLLFNAGHQIHQAAIAQIVADVRSGKIPLARLDEAVRRALRAKQRFKLLAPAPVDAAAAEKICGSAAHRAFALETASAAITLLRDERAILPLAAGQPPLVVGGAAVAGLAPALHGLDVRVGEKPGAGDIAAALAAVRAHPGAPVLVALSGARANPEQAALARQLLDTGAPVVLLAVREPYDLLTIPNLATDRRAALVATYGVNPATVEGLARVLRGERRPSGHLPVELPGLYPLGAGLENFSERPR